jgi:hypothetical protein
MRVTVLNCEKSESLKEGDWIRVTYTVGLLKNRSTLDFFLKKDEEYNRDTVRARVKKALEFSQSPSDRDRIHVEIPPGIF